MEKEYIYGKMEKLIMDNLKMVKKKAMVFGKELKEIHIWEIGFQIKLKDMEFMYGQIKISMKENGKLVLDMEMEQIIFKMEIYILEIISWDYLMVMDNISGKMAIFIKDYLKWE